jgi:hypothetical protein
MRRKAFETSGSLIARPVSLVAAGNVNSGQRAILGVGSNPSLSFGWVNAHSHKRSASAPAAPGLGEGVRSPTVLRR